MPLPILKSSWGSDVDLVRFWHKIELEWSRHLAEEATLDCGTALTNPAFLASSVANRMFDAAVPPGADVSNVVDEVNQHFRAIGCECRQWILNPSAELSRTEPLADYLLASGYRRRSCDIFRLPKAPNLEQA